MNTNQKVFVVACWVFMYGVVTYPYGIFLALTVSINQALGSIDWERAFAGLDLDSRVSFLTGCVINVFSNLVPNKIISVRAKDAKIYKRYVKNGRNALDYQTLCNFSARCKVAIDEAKFNYFTRLGNELNNPDIGSKKYWSILNQILHKRKIPKIPPIQNSRNILITDVSEKANIFNHFLQTSVL